MSSIVLTGDTSGTITVSAPAVAGTRTLTLPAATGTAILEDASGVLQMNSGYGSLADAYGCRAWVNFNGSGTVAIRDSANVSSITDSGVGKWIINFATAMPDANYTVVGTQNFNQSGDDNHTNVVTHIRRVATPLTTTQAYVATSYNQNAHDATMACFVVFR